MRCLVLCLVTLALGACGDSSTCALEDADGELMSCLSYSDLISESDAESSCLAGGGVWQDSACDEEAAIAKCDTVDGSTAWYYTAYLALLGPGASVEDLAPVCEDAGGTFTQLFW